MKETSEDPGWVTRSATMEISLRSLPMRIRVVETGKVYVLAGTKNEKVLLNIQR